MNEQQTLPETENEERKRIAEQEIQKWMSIDSWLFTKFLLVLAFDQAQELFIENNLILAHYEGPFVNEKVLEKGHPKKCFIFPLSEVEKDINGQPSIFDRYQGSTWFNIEYERIPPYFIKYEENLPARKGFFGSYEPAKMIRVKVENEVPEQVSFKTHGDNPALPYFPHRSHLLQIWRKDNLYPLSQRPIPTMLPIKCYLSWPEK